MRGFLLAVTSWIINHPHLDGYTIFFTSFAGSLAFVGLLMPGATMMLTEGALIATGVLSFWPAMAWAVCGAVLAIGISFWLASTLRRARPIKQHLFCKLSYPFVSVCSDQ